MIQLFIYALIAAAVGGYIWHCESTKTAHAVFVAETERLGAEAKEKTDKRIAADRKSKEKADAENTKLRADLAAANKRVRDARAGSGFLPPAAPGARRPDVAPLDRALVERALRDFDQGAQGLIDEGDQARVDLDTARRWAQGRQPPAE